MKLFRTVFLLSGLALARLIAADGSGEFYFNVRAFGAAGDGKSLDTAAIQRAIEACHAAGGGVVGFPAGDFLSGTVVLRSQVTLRLEPGAVLRGSARLSDYDPKHRHLIFADGVENVAIEGRGAIDGQGEAFFTADWTPRERPDQLIEIDNSRGVRIEGVTVRNAANWTIRPYRCDDVKIRGIALLNDMRAVNTDGLQIHSSRNVLISDCHIVAGDDCIVLKTDVGSAEYPTENVTVTNCVLVSSACALKFGTGGRADFRHCLFSNCVIRESRTGIALMEKDGGIIEDVRFENIAITTKPKWGQGLEWPIVVDIERRTNESPTGRIRDISFHGITVYSKGRILVEGMPASCVERVSFRDVIFRVGGFENIQGGHKPRGGPRGASDDSPDYGAAPAAFIFAHVRGISLDGVTLSWPAETAASARHAIWGDDLADVQVTGSRLPATSAGTKPMELQNSPGVKP